ILKDDYVTDEHDNLGNPQNKYEDESPPLYNGSKISVMNAVQMVMKFSLDANLDKSTIIKLMKLVKLILPNPNLLPTTHKSILGTFGKTTLSTTKHLCSHCLSVNKILRNNQITEVVTLDIRSRIRLIIRRNMSLMSEHTELFPQSDISHFSHYRTTTINQVNTITLMLYADGAPLVRSTKRWLWPCFASIVEIPPPARDHEQNIMVVALWVGRGKPGVNVFLNESIQQIKDLMDNGTTIFVDDNEFKIILRTQCFISELPAKSLFLKTVNFNGYYACTCCETSVLYPYNENNYTERTHDEFTRMATEAGGREVVIRGIKGVSALLQILKYPSQIIFDYMHLVYKLIIIDYILSKIQLPHNMNVTFDYSINAINDWKVKHARLFVLYVGLPVLIDCLPSLFLSHFAVYPICIKLLHVPENRNEINMANDLIYYYCPSASLVYNQSIELYSLHSHLHLPKQVDEHGDLAFTSSFSFESCIRYIKNKVHGTKHLAAQISFWCDVETIIRTTKFEIEKSSDINEIDISNHLMDEYRQILLALISIIKQPIEDITFYKRFKQPFITFHTYLYDKHFRCASYIISYINEDDDVIHFDNCILFYKYQDMYFYKYQDMYFVLIQKYQLSNEKISSFVTISQEINEILDKLFSLRVPPGEPLIGYL
ncbi:unnamed protein product, partial [Didymodactylos carnosus]